MKKLSEVNGNQSMVPMSADIFIFRALVHCQGDDG